MKKKQLEKFKLWIDIASSLVTLLGIIAAFWAYYQWRVGRGDHAVEFIFKLDEKFNSKEVTAGRNLIDWDEEYEEIKGRLDQLANKDRERLAIYEQREWKQQPDSPAKHEWFEQRKKTDEKIKKVDAMLQFYETVNTARVEQQAPAAWLSTRYGYWLDYYYSDERKEYRHYIDHYFPDLNRWMHENLSQSPENRYFTSHFAKRSWRPVVAIFYPRIQTHTDSNVTFVVSGHAATGKEAAGYTNNPNRFISNVWFQINTNIWCLINTNGWADTAGTNSWSGTNTVPRSSDNRYIIYAYATDTWGTNSLTNFFTFTLTNDFSKKTEN